MPIRIRPTRCCVCAIGCHSASTWSEVFDGASSVSNDDTPTWLRRYLKGWNVLEHGSLRFRRAVFHGIGAEFRAVCGVHQCVMVRLEQSRVEWPRIRDLITPVANGKQSERHLGHIRMRNLLHFYIIVRTYLIERLSAAAHGKQLLAIVVPGKEAIMCSSCPPRAGHLFLDNHASNKSVISVAHPITVRIR